MKKESTISRYTFVDTHAYIYRLTNIGAHNDREVKKEANFHRFSFETTSKYSHAVTQVL